MALYMIAQKKAGEEQKKMIKQAHEIMKEVNGSKQKIAGKSIPMEVKYQEKERIIKQGQRLTWWTM